MHRSILQNTIGWYSHGHSYTILFDNGTSASIPLSEMPTIIPKPPVDIDSSDSQDSLLPPFLWLNSKITYEHVLGFIQLWYVDGQTIS
jgi:hypothetical protein